MYGYQGERRVIDLTHKSVSDQEDRRDVCTSVYRRGGIRNPLARRSPAPHVDPLSADNLLILSSGPLSAVKFMGSAGLSLVTKSPLTGLLGDSDLRGAFGSNLKSCGCDTLIIQGKSDTPVYIELSDGTAKIKDAADLWGKTTAEVQIAAFPADRERDKRPLDRTRGRTSGQICLHRRRYAIFCRPVGNGGSHGIEESQGHCDDQRGEKRRPSPIPRG